MGIDDRDYMRERYRARTKETRWNDRAGRVEGAWFAPVNRGHDYQRGRSRSSRPASGSILRWLPFGLGIVLIAIPSWHELKREGWLPDPAPELSFPESGSVTLSAGVDPGSEMAQLAVTTADAHAVVQLFDPGSGGHVISVYVRKNDRTTVAVPAGIYRVKIAEGQRWHGRKEFFGTSTAYETVSQLMVFRRAEGHGIDLNRRPNGNLRTRANWRGPSPL